MIRWFEHRQVYAPSRTLEASGAELGRPFEDVRFLTSDGVSLHGWFFPANPGSPRGHLVIVLLHGNVGNISRRLHFYQAWLELGVNVFAFDYRGFGRSEGRPSEEGTYRDAQAAVQWLREKGLAASAKRDDRESTQGAVALFRDGNVGAIVELKSETDFVASSERSLKCRDQ